MLFKPENIDWPEANTIAERLAAVTYSEYPKWLQHSSRSSVIVNDADQEKIFVADGYFAPGCSDPEGYLLSKVTTKLDDAIRTMNRNIEQKVSTALVSLRLDIDSKISKAFDAMQNAQSIKEAAEPLKDLQDSIENSVTQSISALAVDAMEAIRQIAKSTNSG